MGLIEVVNSIEPEVDLDEIHDELEQLLLRGENVLMALPAVRHTMTFTGMRLILVDRQVEPGERVENVTVPYGAIVSFSMGRAEHPDTDAQVSVWLTSRSDPLTCEFASDQTAIDAYRILSHAVLD